MASINGSAGAVQSLRGSVRVKTYADRISELEDKVRQLDAYVAARQGRLPWTVGGFTPPPPEPAPPGDLAHRLAAALNESSELGKYRVSEKEFREVTERIIREYLTRNVGTEFEVGETTSGRLFFKIVDGDTLKLDHTQATWLRGRIDEIIHRLPFFPRGGQGR